MKLFRHVIIFLSCLTCICNVVAQNVLTISEDKPLTGASRYCEILEDKHHAITYDSLIKYNYTFYPYTKPYINLGITSSSFWLKMNVINTTNQKLYIEVGNTALDSIAVFEMIDGLVTKHVSGNWQAYYDRELKNTNYLFPISTITNKAKTIYLWVRHTKGTQFVLTVGTAKAFHIKTANSSLYAGMYYGLILAMIFYNLFIYFSLKDPPYLFYVSYTFFMGLLNASLMGHAFKYLWPHLPQVNLYVDVIAIFVGLSGIMFVVKFLDTKNNAPFFHKLFKVLSLLYLVNIVPIVLGYPMAGTYIVELLSLVVIVCFFFCAIIAMRKDYKPAKFFLIAWSLLLLSIIVFILKDFGLIPYHPITANALQIGSAVEALLLSMALANRINIYKREKEKAQLEAIAALSEKKQLITEQNVTLERQVEARTLEIQTKHDELENALKDLKQTQGQLIQREKMASLGELTTGIAHEIQNPLNFVNNFSDVTEEMVDELIEKTIKDSDSLQARDTIDMLENLKQNVKVISEHGRRADMIVKSMLQHSQQQKGMLEPTEINLLVDEYLKLTFIGFKSKNKDFNARLVVNLQKDIGKINIVPQDIARVLINLFNNAFYALLEKKSKAMVAFEPQLCVSTQLSQQMLELHIKDNGTGIPADITHKIFQPFYTTKPSGKGTGLGLSISYDIVTKEHNGELKVESKEDEYTEFIIKIPVQNKS